jgi:methionine-rich copper-binding protein CopC
MRPAIQAVAKLALALLLAAPAQAHTHLLRATPAEGSVLSGAPRQLQLGFSEAATLTALSIHRTGDAAALNLPLPALQAAVSFSIDLPPLRAGSYVVSWRALSRDHHIASGTLSFTVQAPPAS